MSERKTKIRALCVVKDGKYTQITPETKLENCQGLITTSGLFIDFSNSEVYTVDETRFDTLKLIFTSTEIEYVKPK